MAVDIEHAESGILRHAPSHPAHGRSLIEPIPLVPFAPPLTHESSQAELELVDHVFRLVLALSL